MLKMKNKNMNIKHGDYVKLANSKIYRVVANEKNGSMSLYAPFNWGGAVELYQKGCWGGPIVEILSPDKKPPHIHNDPRGYFEFYNMLDTWETLKKISGIVANEGSKPQIASN